ncbi:MAG TPA: acyl carrier protein [Candidatus Polarisedimenticolaceae bacterium]|nr:acyl carrier protein [Candidatus Polarisedimenticolaceae bacterium]
MRLEDQIRRFIAEHFFIRGGEAAVSDDMSFLETRIMDSTGVLEFVGFLEATFGIKVEDDELTPENLDSVRLAAAYVERKRRLAPQASS